jgi:hypothetical protein
MSAAASARGCRAGRGPCGAMADGREKALPFLGNDEGTYRGQMSSLLQILAYYYVLDARTRHVSHVQFALPYYTSTMIPLIFS